MRIIMLLAAIIITSTVSAQNNYTTTLNDVRFAKTGGAFATMTIYSENTFKKDGKTGYNMFLLVTKGWGEVYAGVWYKPAPKVQMSLAAGIETGSSVWRLGTSVIYFGDTKGGFFQRMLVKGFAEKGKGADNYWYHLSVQYQTPHWRFGGMVRRYYGVGPWVQYSVAKTRLTLGAAYLYEFEIKERRPTAFVGWDFGSHPFYKIIFT